MKIRNALSGDVSSIANNLDDYYGYLDEINSKDTSKNTQLLEESNIQEVIEFIQNTIRPQAAETKEYTIKRDLKKYL